METSKIDEASIHPGFTAEVESRRLARKRRKRSFTLDSNEDDVFTHSPTPPANDPDLEIQAVHSGDTVHQPSPSLTTNDRSNADERKNRSDLEDCEARGVISKMGPSTSTAMDNDDQSLDTPRDGWKLHSDKYFKKVADYIKSSLNRDMTKKGHVYTFQERLRKSELRRTHQEKQFWVIAGPFIDAWLLMLARKRDVFDMKKFAQKHPETGDDLNILRKTANVRVMADHCPFSLAIEATESHQSDADQNEEDSAHEPPRPRSQSYWTKIKSRCPW